MNLDTRVSSRALSILVISCVAVLGSADAHAQVSCNATPIVSGLLSPMGVAQSSLGNLIVSETGAHGVLHSGRISIVDRRGGRRTLVDGLPSGTNDVNEPSGPAGVFMRGRTLYGRPCPAVNVLEAAPLRSISMSVSCQGHCSWLALSLHMLVLRRDWHGVDSSGLAMLLSGRLLGTIPAALLLASLPLESMKLLLAGVVLAGALMGVLHSGAHADQARAFRRRHRVRIHGDRGWSGRTSGRPHLSARNRRTSARHAYFIIGTIVSLFALAWAGRFTREEMRLSLQLIPRYGPGLLQVASSGGVSRRWLHEDRRARRSTLAAVSVIATVLM